MSRLSAMLPWNQTWVHGGPGSLLRLAFGGQAVPATTFRTSYMEGRALSRPWTTRSRFDELTVPSLPREVVPPEMAVGMNDSGSGCDCRGGSASSLPAGRAAGSRSWWAAAAAVAATYFYFLIFAEFALLELARAINPDGLRVVMIALGGSGVSGAVFAAWIFTVERQRALLAWAFRTAALAAAAASVAGSFGALLPAAILAGGSLGALTVALASALRGATGGFRLGTCIGIGTGTAYALSNLPWLFAASPAFQAAAAAAVALAASWLARGMEPAEPDELGSRADYAAGGVVRWLTILLALVWMDSAAFYVIQHVSALREVTWTGTGALTGNAAVHLGFAVLAGVLLDRGRAAVVAALAVALLAVGCSMLNGTLGGWTAGAGWFYAAGVSLYSVVLVHYPARSGRPWLAALVFAVAGWGGSALGIGMAQDLAQVPPAFVVAALLVVATALGWRLVALRRGAIAAAVLVSGGAIVRGESSAETALIQHGREVYIAEGCIHCHSQFIRPLVPQDVEQWGPAEPLQRSLSAAPPLFGTRRQGPDLARVGNRRSPEWNRLHLMSPQAVSPGSRMPAYAHLFKPGDERGAALVAYLASLGAETMAERQAQIAAWVPDTTVVADPAVARRRFAQLCTPCHGAAGRGDGRMAAALSLPPPDWQAAGWRRVPPGIPIEPALSRIIKFGIPGSPMAGHEYLPDADVVGLARLVRSLHDSGAGGRAGSSSHEDPDRGG